MFDPRIGDLAAEYETTSDRVRVKLADPHDWCFCELCGQVTEFALAISERARGFYKRNGAEVALGPEICAKAERAADELAKRYEQALAGTGTDDPIQMIIKHCGIDGFRRLRSEELRDRGPEGDAGEISVEQFRLHVEGQVRMALWAKRADFIGAKPRPGKAMPGGNTPQKPSRAGEPSRLYCARHNQGRSDEARRNYQRDVKRANDYRELISQLWAEHAAKLPTWDIEAHAHVRQEAYRLLQEFKPRQKRSPAGMIEELLNQGVTNQSEIARQLNVSRQAVSAAIKRRERAASN